MHVSIYTHLFFSRNQFQFIFSKLSNAIEVRIAYVLLTSDKTMVAGWLSSMQPAASKLKSSLDFFFALFTTINCSVCFDMLLNSLIKFNR